MPSESPLAALVRRYLEALTAGVTGDELAAFFTPDVVQQELPNRLNPAGVTRDLAAILDGAARGAARMASQVYEVRSLVVDGDRAAVEVDWTGTLRSPVPGLPATLRARFAFFLELRDGRIAYQRNYDCFDPW